MTLLTGEDISICMIMKFWKKFSKEQVLKHFENTNHVRHTCNILIGWTKMMNGEWRIRCSSKDRNNSETLMDSKKILYFQYTDPAIGYPPLEHSSAILARKGWKVLFLGVTQSQGYFRLEGHPKIKMKRLFCPKRGWGQKLNYVGFN